MLAGPTIHYDKDGDLLKTLSLTSCRMPPLGRGGGNCPCCASRVCFRKSATAVMSTSVLYFPWYRFACVSMESLRMPSEIPSTVSSCSASVAEVSSRESANSTEMRRTALLDAIELTASQTPAGLRRDEPGRWAMLDRSASDSMISGRS